MTTRKPFFTRFLAPQVQSDVKAGATLKYPSDKDEVIYVTLKYPSDGDDDPVAL